jgi:hypothetical protein
MDHIHIKLGSIPIRIRSDDREFLEYTLDHFAPAVIDSTERYSVDLEFARGALDVLGSFSRHDLIGRGIYSDGQSVIWDSVPYFPGLTMGLKFENGTLSVKASHTPPRSINNTAKKFVRAILGRMESKSVFYFELLYYVVYYPVFRVLLDRGIHPLHGGGVEVGGRRVVVAGAQGTGKSTLIANLLAEPGSRFLSDNIVLFDAERVYSCHEPIRLDTNMLKAKPALQGMLDKIDLDVPLGRTAVNLQRKSCVEEMEPDIFIIPRIFHSATTLDPCTKTDAIRKVRCFNSLADEVRSFEVFSSVLGQVFPPHVPPCHDLETLDRLLEGRELYELGIRFGEDPEETARNLIEMICP